MLEFPPTVPFTSHVTAVLVELVVVVFERFTVAVKSVCAPGFTVAVEGVIETDATVTAPLPPPHPERSAMTMTRTPEPAIVRAKRHPVVTPKTLPIVAFSPCLLFGDASYSFPIRKKFHFCPGIPPGGLESIPLHRCSKRAFGTQTRFDGSFFANPALDAEARYSSCVCLPPLWIGLRNRQFANTNILPFFRGK
jgi:hypothetical protein